MTLVYINLKMTGSKSQAEIEFESKHFNGLPAMKPTMLDAQTVKVTTWTSAGFDTQRGVHAEDGHYYAVDVKDLAALGAEMKANNVQIFVAGSQAAIAELIGADAPADGGTRFMVVMPSEMKPLPYLAAYKPKMIDGSVVTHGVVHYYGGDFNSFKAKSYTKADSYTAYEFEAKDAPAFVKDFIAKRHNDVALVVPGTYSADDYVAQLEKWGA